MLIICCFLRLYHRKAFTGFGRNDTFLKSASVPFIIFINNTLIGIGILLWVIKLTL